MADAAAPPPALAIPAPPSPVRIAIPVIVPSTRQCDPAAGDEIVVCAVDPAAFRLGMIAAKPEPGLPKAEFKLSGNASIGVQLQSGSLGNTPTNRAMITLKVAF